jgi:ADP-L-glycero-D-manno-heptose 6-epimerase
MAKIVVTGAAGFIGSCLAQQLNDLGYTDLILVDNFDVPSKWVNHAHLKCSQKINRDLFLEWFTDEADEVSFVFHLGARTDTTEFNFRVLDSLNLSYTKAIWEICTVKQIPLVYASSAATYGLGEQGFDDDEKKVPDLKPLNPYGLSKQLFDVFALEQEQTPPFWCGLKFFNVYGPHENHKGRMASVVYHAFNQIKATSKVKLFQSHVAAHKDGEQLRDFIYVDDVVNVCLFWMAQVASEKASKINAGIYNLGTGTARSFNDLAQAIFLALDMPSQIEYIPIPEDIRDKYQYYTKAEMGKLVKQGYQLPFTSLEDGVKQYVAYLNQTTA